jgi:ferredoxin-NADP reductase
MYNIQLLDKKEIAQNTAQFSFEKPADFVFQAGQYVSMKIEGKHVDKKGSFRSFSIASAPYEKTLDFSMRKSESAFKQNLFALPIGGEVEITPAVGKSILPELSVYQNIVFLVGGVGITPARSMLHQAQYDQRPEKFYLFNSNRTPDSAPFRDEFFGSDAEKYTIDCTIINTITDEDVSWEGERGYITDDMIQKHVDNLASSRFYVVGTAGFITAMKEMLLATGIPQENIIFDNFG